MENGAPRLKQNQFQGRDYVKKLGRERSQGPFLDVLKNNNPGI